MPIISERGGLWADILDPIVKFKFDLAFQRRASLLATLFNVQSSTRAYEQISGIGAIGVDSWNNYNNSGQVSEVDFNQGYKKTYTHVEYVVDLGIERKTIDDNQHGDVFRQVERLGDSAALKRETDGAAVFNNAFTDSAAFHGADGKPLCSASHPLSPMNAGTQSNTGTAQLTKAAVSTTREAMMAFTDDNGNKMAVTPTALLVPPSLEDEALEISKSLLDPTSANNTINVHAGRFQVIVWHYLTGNDWFMLDTNLMKMSLDWFDRVAPGTKLRDGDDRTLIAYWRSYMRYSFGWNNWMWVYGNNVA